MTNSLSNKKILVTKSKEQAEKAFSKLGELGAEIIYFPTIKIVSKIEDDHVKEVLLKSYKYDYFLFFKLHLSKLVKCVPVIEARIGTTNNSNSCHYC